MRTEIMTFEEMAPRTAYEVWRLRQDVFVVEQSCPYADLDGRDVEEGTRHLILWIGDDVVGTLRILDDDPHWRIGRVVLAPRARGRGLAEAMMQAALTATSDRDVVLDAQSPLAQWYRALGFAVVGDEFVEDGTPHLPMRLFR
ncbi:GNAT family N-acetyltransferase [Microlunatus sp. Gsoil 973]|uniref:GNAT family N-acetyltransferase n=1 Tax=Microlunatus sp. Gsoil 973 TaxID=2672569 RepID=UPI0012B4B0C1|nr:GNAT family N-acetyltransferase [Microlunatus sp. Gsoil 973]QGN34800.1 GNAT family N-acetyltransferase [Microlunatus sp. Gsoil 973]